jgi:hypothetical protein
LPADQWGWRYGVQSFGVGLSGIAGADEEQSAGRHTRALFTFVLVLYGQLRHLGRCGQGLQQVAGFTASLSSVANWANCFRERFQRPVVLVV